MQLIYPLKKNPEKILEDIKAKIIGFGGTFSGTLISGDFSIKGIVGKYKTDNNNLILDIIKHPIFLPEWLIKKEIDIYVKKLN